MVNEKTVSSVRRVSEITQWVRALAAQPDGPSSIARPSMVEGESRLLQVVLSPPHVNHGIYA